jgi:deferrochelatase/peroxidase EfeB
MTKGKAPGARPDTQLTRRGMLFGAAAGTIGAAACPVAAFAAAQPAPPATPGEEEDMIDLTRSIPFYGTAEQAGIRTPPQRHLFYMTFDLTSSARRDLQVLLARWSAAIAQMAEGKTIGQVEPQRADGIGLDTGEALNHGPAALTVTVGLGPKVYTDT